MTIADNVKQLMAELPPGVELVAAAKTKTIEEILEAVAAGVKIIGENYVQEAERAREVIGDKVKWHFIGHLQKNKVKRAVRIFDMIETVDSFEIAREIDRYCCEINKIMPVLIEINSGKERQKTGLFPEDAEQIISSISCLANVRVMGLMTMAPYFDNPEDSRPYFKETRKLFERMAQLHIPNITMRYLSMGMTDSYRVAIGEGANMVRIGTKIFGERGK